MGGHTELSTFYTLREAVDCWRDRVYKFETTMSLCLRAAKIEYDPDTLLYTLSMRFTK